MLRRVVLLVTSVTFLSIAIAACGSGEAQPSSAPAASQATQPTSGAGAVAGALQVKLQDPGGSGKYLINPNELAFSAGEMVTFAFTSETEFHNFVVEDLGIDVSVDAGATETLAFTFDKPGTYEVICIPHLALGMVGEITVQ